ncbi:hypothetical protein F383_28077 [Gossypium arboreum]|uniref:Uncharacterized protein n=1 Tax=Gossypium arboreum TaxID=29729 RepID=A0A0B0PDZ1_GOSAR|nr:hypothetical protein F383_28077 [Gossypium arboreum]
MLKPCVCHTAKPCARVLGRIPKSNILFLIFKLQGTHGLITCPYDTRPCVYPCGRKLAI